MSLFVGSFIVDCLKRLLEQPIDETPVLLPVGIDALCETLGLEKLDETPSWNDVETLLPREIRVSRLVVSLPREFHRFIRLPRAFRSLRQLFPSQVLFPSLCQLVGGTAGKCSRLRMLSEPRSSAAVSLLRSLRRHVRHLTPSSAREATFPPSVCCGAGRWRRRAAVRYCWTCGPRRSFSSWGEDSSWWRHRCDGRCGG